MKETILLLAACVFLLAGCGLSNEKNAAVLAKKAEAIYKSTRKSKTTLAEKIKGYKEAKTIINQIQADYPETNTALSLSLVTLSAVVDESFEEAKRLLKKSKTKIDRGGKGADRPINSLLF